MLGIVTLYILYLLKKYKVKFYFLQVISQKRGSCFVFEFLQRIHIIVIIYIENIVYVLKYMLYIICIYYTYYSICSQLLDFEKLQSFGGRYIG